MLNAFSKSFLKYLVREKIKKRKHYARASVKWSSGVLINWLEGRRWPFDFLSVARVSSLCLLVDSDDTKTCSDVALWVVNLRMTHRRTFFKLPKGTASHFLRQWGILPKPQPWPHSLHTDSKDLGSSNIKSMTTITQSWGNIFALEDRKLPVIWTDVVCQVTNYLDMEEMSSYPKVSDFCNCD